MDFKFNFFYNYFNILNKTIVRKLLIHVLISIIDTIIVLVKSLNIYYTDYNKNISKAYKKITPSLYFSDYNTVIKSLPIIIYLIIVYLILFFSIFFWNNNKTTKMEMIIINIFELFFIRILFIFFCELIFYLSTLYFLIFFLLTLPYLIFILLDMTYFHLGYFMLKIVQFPFDAFTSICDREKLIIKILISIASISRNIYICKFVYFLQIILLIGFCVFNTYLLLRKSYFLMSNEFYDKIRYSNLLNLTIIQIFALLMKNEEIFNRSFITIIICLYLFITIFIFISYDPYNFIVIHSAENPNNLYYYFYLKDRNKNISYYLSNKIKEHIAICNCCTLCERYLKLSENKNNVIELVNENEENECYDNVFNVLYNGKDKLMILFNQLINNMKKTGNNCLNNNLFYPIKFNYMYYYSLNSGDITFSLNMILLFNLIEENNTNLISIDKIAINQIMHINEFLILYKEIISQIKEIISKNSIKRYIEKFFTLSKKLKVLNSRKFKQNLFMTKIEGTTNYSYLLNICSLLYEEIFNKSISSHSIPIRENPQLIEDILKNFGKQSNHIILNFNLKTMECKILNSGFQLIDYINKNFYDLFPNQIKVKLIQNFCDEILNPKEKKLIIQTNKNTKQKTKQYIEISLVIKNNENNVNYFWILYLKLSLLFNCYIRENIILNGYFVIYKNSLMTIKDKDNKEKILGFGSKEIMNASYSKKLNYQKFLLSDYMKNKTTKEAFNLIINNNIFYIYTIIDNKIKRKNNISRELNKQYTNFHELKFRSKYEQDIFNVEDENDNNLKEITSDNPENNLSNNDYVDNSQRVRNLLEDNASQSSAMTKTTLSSFWNMNKSQSRDNQSHFTSKKFFKLQMILGILLLILLILIIILLLKIKIKQNAIYIDCNNYLDLIQFIRIFQQFSVQFLTLICVSITPDGECKSYISQFDTKEFNQTLFLSEQNEVLAEFGSQSINDLIINSESIHDSTLINLLKGNFTYNLINKKKINNKYNLSRSLIDVSMNDALLLTSNNMRIIVSKESRLKSRNKEPIYLLTGYSNPFKYLNNLTEDLSDYQIAVYTYLLNFRSLVFRFADLNQRFHTLINKRNNELLNTFHIMHNIIFAVMIFQIITIVFYLYTYNSVLSEIINSLISKFDVIFDSEHDFKKLYSHKIDLLESLVNNKNYNIGDSINSINKNCVKYENLVGINKMTEQRLNMNKKLEKDDEKETLFKNNQKYINWIDIYDKGYDRFYIIFTIVILVIDVIIFAIIFCLWKNYEKKYILTLKLIHDSWDFERYTLRMINFYHHMIFANQTLDNITEDYFRDNEYSCIENFLIILKSYNLLQRQKHESGGVFKSYEDFCDYNCQSLFDYMRIISSSWKSTLNVMEEKYGINQNILTQRFVEQCEKAQTFILDSVTPAFQGFYQKCLGAMIQITDRTYQGLINKLFYSDLPSVTSIFLNVTRYILYIIGKESYTGSFEQIIDVLEKTIIFSLVLYIATEVLLLIFFFFVYIWNINRECKNMYILKRVFEITNSNDN